MMPQNTLLMERKSGEAAEVRILQEKLSQLNQAVAKITDEKVRMICNCFDILYLYFLVLYTLHDLHCYLSTIGDEPSIWRNTHTLIY